MPSEPKRRSPYPPVDVAIALAERSHSLPGSDPAARARLAFVAALGAERGWSSATRAAHAMREIDWEVLARHLDDLVPRLQSLEPVVLLARLDRRPIRDTQPRAA